jgi:phosphatidylserine/phosphatidylglycerophosphate/cardiolipin synthase-like enzyme
MRTAISAAFFSSAMLFCFADDASKSTPPPLSVHFSPDGGCTDSIEAAAAAAKNRIYVQAYVLTSTRIATALVKAKNRGVSVEVILDNKGSKINGSKYAWLLTNGVKVVLDKSHPIAHNKIFVIDGRQVITGSFNFTEQAEARNAENLMEVNDERIAKAYEENWQTHRRHSLEPLPEETAEEKTPPRATIGRSDACPTGQCPLPQTVNRFRRR